MTDIDVEFLIEDLIRKKISMVYKENFDTVLQHKNTISNLEGDIIECGCWRGGFSIFLSKIFKNKKIWAIDSFEGFQNLRDAKYSYSNERHIPQFTHNSVGPLIIEYQETYNNFVSYGLLNDIESGRVNLIKGFVRDSTIRLAESVDQISLLRIDVDAYSATMEILDNLYDKVVDGGYIIFDDSCLVETKDAIKDFLQRIKLPLRVKHPIDDTYLDISKIYTNDNSGLPCGCFIIKGEN